MASPGIRDQSQGLGIPAQDRGRHQSPITTMQYLIVRFAQRTLEEIEAFVAAVSQMTQLKELELEFLMFDFPIVDPEHLLTNLFSSMKHREELKICFPYKMDGTVDGAIDRLVRNNPRLAHIDISNAIVTASLVSFSSLTGLQSLVLWRDRTNMPEFTTDNILTLLRGGSRQVLRSVSLCPRSRPDKGRIEAEVKIMGQEMGKWDARSPSSSTITFRSSFRE